MRVLLMDLRIFARALCRGLLASNPVRTCLVGQQRSRACSCLESKLDIGIYGHSKRKPSAYRWRVWYKSSESIVVVSKFLVLRPLIGMLEILKLYTPAPISLLKN